MPHMQFEIAELSPPSAAAYGAALGDYRERTIYHTLEWLHFLRDAFGATPATLLAVADGRIIGVLPLAVTASVRGRSRLVSLPYSHCVEALGETTIVAALIEAAAKRARQRGWRFELRRAAPSETATFVDTVVPLNRDVPSMRRRIDRKTRNQLQQAEGNPRLRLRAAESAADFSAMDQIMAINRRHLGSATYARGFFARLQRALGDLVRCEVAVLDTAPVAFMVTSCVGEQAIYHYGASLPDARSVRPNNLLMWSALCWAAVRGAIQLDLGTSLPSQAGLIRFKESWGGSSRRLLYAPPASAGATDAASAQGGWPARVAGAVVRVLPMPIYRRVTPLLIREFG